MVKRIFVEKRASFNVPAKNLLEDFRETLDIKNLRDVRLFVRYDIEDLDDEDFDKVRDIVFRELNVDDFYFELPADVDLAKTFAIEYLPGQFDIRADSAEISTADIVESMKVTLDIKKNFCSLRAYFF